MNRLNMYAFADEASGQIDKQIAAMQRNGLQGLEIRGVDGQNIADISVEKAREVRRKLDDAGLTVWSMGSPIGKIGIEDDGFAAHLDKLRHVLTLAEVLGAKNLRMFSFFVPEGKAAEYRGKVMDQVGQMVDAARGSGVALCHENEKGIYGENAPHCLAIHKAVPRLRAVFDPANFVQCGQDVMEAWEMLAPYVEYCHIKDAAPDGHIVPPGDGIGALREYLPLYAAQGGVVLTLEPHLAQFVGLKALEGGQERSEVGGLNFENNRAAFDHAVMKLKEILNA